MQMALISIAAAGAVMAGIGLFGYRFDDPAGLGPLICGSIVCLVAVHQLTSIP